MDITVEHRGGDRFAVLVRGHRLIVDQPVEDGGEDRGPTPTELFVAGLAACVGFYAERFLRRHGLAIEGLAVECRYSMSPDRPARVTGVSLEVLLPAGFPDERREALVRVVERCTVHNSLTTPPEVWIGLRDRTRAA